jgi:hypothetical protein
MLLMSVLTLTDGLCCALFTYPVLGPVSGTCVDAGSNTSTVALRVI